MAKIGWKNWKIHVIALVLTIIADFIGPFSFELGPGSLALLPLIYTLAIGILLGFDFVNNKLKLLKVSDMENSASLTGLIILVFAARLGTMVGPNLPQVVEAGIPLLLQEFGNLGTLLIAMPIAIFLGLRRESIGGTFSISRESGIPVMAEVFGVDSPEGRGFFGVYITGLLLGSIFIAFFAGIIAAMDIFHPLALAMASGVGSASMMTTSSTAIAAAIPEYSDQIMSFAATSNLLTSATGIYMMIFISIPLAKIYYRFLCRVFSIKESGLDD